MRPADRGLRIVGPPNVPVLVLANSLGTTSSMWDPQLAVLQQRFRVVCYEHRGHGRTAAPPGPYTIADMGADLLAVIDEIGAGRASLMGLSLGGMAAMWVAAHHPERVDRLVLCCTAPQLPGPEALIARAAQVRSSGTVSLLPALMGRWFTAGYRERRPQLSGTVAAMLEAADPEGYAACCEAIAAMDQWADLDRITAPTLIIAGAEDPVAPPDIALRMQQAIRGAALTVLADAAHLANVEQAAAFTAAALGHLAGIDIERGEAVRRAVLGDAHVDQAAGATDTFVAPFTEFITRYAWGDVWTRPGLDRRTRSAVTLALLAALGRTDELAVHVAGAVRNGLSPDEIGEILLHTAVYAGVPAARTALLVADRALRDDARG